MSGIKQRAGSPTARTGFDERNARLAMSLSGTNLARAGDYNQRVVLQAIRIGGECTRSGLAEVTGLTAPTIANITKRLLDQGLLRDAGRRHGGRGQPAVRLVINPEGCFSVGVNVDRDHITVVTLDLAGRVRSRAVREAAFIMPGEAARFVREEVAQVIERGEIDPRRICGIGVAIPDGLARTDYPHRPAGYDEWNAVDPARLFGDILPVTVHVDNDAAAAAIGEAQFGHGIATPSFFYVLVSAGLGGGLVIDGSYYRGAQGRSGELGFLPAGGSTLESVFSLSTLTAALEAAGEPASVAGALDEGSPGKPVLDRWIERSVAALVDPIVSINCLVNPGAVLIGGRLPEPVIDRVVDDLNRALAASADRLPALAPVRRAAMSADAPAIGAAILPFNDLILPSQASLMKVA